MHGLGTLLIHRKGEEKQGPVPPDLFMTVTWAISLPAPSQSVHGRCGDATTQSTSQDITSGVRKWTQCSQLEATTF